MGHRLIVIPRWAGTPTADFYPWLRAQLQARSPQPFDDIVVADMPAPGQPTIDAWVAHTRELLGSDPSRLATTLVVGHSVGCQAVLRALAELPEGQHVKGVICVAGWFWTDEPWDSLRPWIETPFEVERTKAAAGQPVAVLLSDNDRFTSDWRANQIAWQERLGAKVTIVPGADHFNGEQYPGVLGAVLDAVDA